MPLKREPEKLGSQKNNNNSTKKASIKKESVTTKVQKIKKEISQEEKNHTKKQNTHSIIVFLLVLNLIIWIILLCKLSKIQSWTISWNWGEDNFEHLQWIYNSKEYKTYIRNEILNLESQLREKETE